MRRKDLPDRRDLEIRTGLRLCPIQSGEADLTARRVAHNHENDTSKNQKVRKSSHVFVEMGRQVPSEIFEVHGKEGRGPHLHLGTLVLPLRFLQIELGHRSERGEVLSKQNESLDAVVTQRRVVMYGPLAVLESADGSAHNRTAEKWVEPSMEVTTNQ